MFCKEEDEKEKQSSFLSLFMKVDAYGKCIDTETGESRLSL